MTLLEYINHGRGNAIRLASDVGVYPPDISMWANKTRPIPHKYGALIEKHTNGLVTRQELFPDEWQTIWPELLQKDAA
ncbi:MAG: hypothetical protein RLZZ469_1670 [Bacteroidota bacterium]|jgi:DNA-binding transcriptional regulator YdaS (Cro superfamily)